MEPKSRYQIVYPTIVNYYFIGSPTLYKVFKKNLNILNGNTLELEHTLVTLGVP
jgi:hypothetical protein